MVKNIHIEESPLSKFLFSSTAMAWFWLVVRVYVGWTWLEASIEKLQSTAWIGPQAGSALAGFIKGALAKTGGAHPDVQGWYASFLQNTVLPHAGTWSHVVAFGELCIGAALIIGALTGIAAAFGLFMNLNFLLAGAVSINPILFVLSLGLVLAWRVAGYYGCDSALLPLLGVPWHGGKVFQRATA